MLHLLVTTLILISTTGKKDSWAVVVYAPELFDPDKYNWKDASHYIVRYTPQFFDPDRYNWEDYSNFVLSYAPHLIDYKRTNWKQIYKDSELSSNAF